MSVETHTGSCHCGAIRFEADIDLAEGSNRCNCSYCAKARMWFAFAKGAERFRLIDGVGVSEYRWTPPGMPEPHLTFTFCRVCGVRTFAKGNLESLGGTFHAISVPTLDLSDERRAAIPVRYINGRDGRYEEAPAHPEAI
jgi:hypothetical protein